MGLDKGAQLRKGDIVERLAATFRRSQKAAAVGKRECDVGFACRLADTLLQAAENDSHLSQHMQVIQKLQSL